MSTTITHAARRDTARRRAPLKRGRRPIPMLRQRILASAEHLFGEKGFERVLIDEVAAHAGIGKGSIYRQFATKEELYASVVIDGFSRLRKQVAAALESAESFETRIVTVVSQMLSYFWTRRQFFILLRDPTRLPARQQRRYNAEREKLSSLVTQVLQAGVRAGKVRADLDCALMAEAMLGMMRGIQRYRRESVGVEQGVTTVVRMFLDGASS